MLYTFCGRLCAHRLLRHARHSRQIYVVGDAALTGGRWLPEYDRAVALTAAG